MLAVPDLQLTPALQDYLEAIRMLHAAEPGARVTDIAAALGTKLPTVVRSIARLRRLGLVIQEERGRVYPTPAGAALAAQLAHRHADVARFLREVLGVPPIRAEADACVLEHGLSADSAQRLHEFLERWDAAPAEARLALRPRRDMGVDRAGAAAAPDFDLLGSAAGAGSRQ
jgi:DtxR family Mn-dependent transcriptional regulator